VCGEAGNAGANFEEGEYLCEVTRGFYQGGQIAIGIDPSDVDISFRCRAGGNDDGIAA